MPASPQKSAISPRISTLIALAVLATFALLLVMPYLHGHWRLADDSYENTLPLFRFQQRVLSLGQWPHWNLNEGFGKPVAVNPATMFFYPPVPIWGRLVGWSETSYLYFLALHLIAGAGLAFHFARRLKLTLEAATLFGLSYIGNGYVLGFFSNFCLLMPYLFWPLLGEGLWELHDDQEDDERVRESQAPARALNFRAIPKIAAALILIETSGYPLTKLIIYLSTAAAAFPLIRRHSKSLIVASLIALTATAAEWATALRAISLSERMGTDIYGDISYGSPTNFMALGTMLVPTAFLKRDAFQLGMVWLERSWWVGGLTLALIGAAYRKGVLSLTPLRRFALIALAGLLFSFGGHSFFRELSSVTVPLLQHLRFANMGRVLPMIFLCWLGASGLSALQATPKPERLKLVTPEHRQARQNDPATARAQITWLWTAFIGACTIVAISQVSSSALSNQLYFDPATQWPLGLLHTAFYLLLAYSAYMLRWSLTQNAGWPAVLVLVQFLSLADVGYAFRHLVARESPNGLRAAEENFTFASPQKNERSLKRWLEGEDWIRWDGNDKVFNAYTVPYHRWMRTAAADPLIGPLASSLVSCQSDAATWSLRADISGTHSCANAAIAIDRYYGNTIDLRGITPQPAWIVVHDFVDPDWHAELNGIEVPIQAARGVLKAVEVPAGKPWTLHFEYRHPWFQLLGWISAAGYLCLISALYVASKRPQ